jgi:hypothetical protein
VWQRPLSGLHSIMMEKFGQAVRMGCCIPSLFHCIHHHVQSCGVRQLRGHGYTLPISTLPLHVLSVRSRAVIPIKIHNAGAVDRMISFLHGPRRSFVYKLCFRGKVYSRNWTGLYKSTPSVIHSRYHVLHLHRGRYRELPKLSEWDCELVS